MQVDNTSSKYGINIEKQNKPFRHGQGLFKEVLTRRRRNLEKIEYFLKTCLVGTPTSKGETTEKLYSLF